MSFESHSIHKCSFSDKSMQHYIYLSSHAKKQVCLTYLKMTDYTFLFYEQKKISHRLTSICAEWYGMNFCTVWLTLKWPRTTFFYNGIEWYSLFDNDVQHSSANSTKHRFIQVQYDFGSVQSMILVIVVNLSIQQLELQLLSMVSYPLTATVGGLARGVPRGGGIGGRCPPQLKLSKKSTEIGTTVWTLEIFLFYFIIIVLQPGA